MATVSDNSICYRGIILAATWYWYLLGDKRVGTAAGVWAVDKAGAPSQQAVTMSGAYKHHSRSTSQRQLCQLRQKGEKNRELNHTSVAMTTSTPWIRSQNPTGFPCRLVWILLAESYLQSTMMTRSCLYSRCNGFSEGSRRRWVSILNPQLSSSPDCESWFALVEISWLPPNQSFLIPQLHQEECFASPATES